jgi:hypothetical protein
MLGFSSDQQVRVSYSGGVFCAEDLVLLPFVEELNKRAPNYLVTSPIYSPVIGAALYACRISGKSLEPAALDRLKR